MNMVLGPELEPFVFVYFDDVIMATRTFEEHMRVLSKVRQKLKDACLTINVEKCKFCVDSLGYLGFVLDRRGLHMNPAKVAAMLEYPRPNTVNQLKRFLSMCS